MVKAWTNKMEPENGSEENSDDCEEKRRFGLRWVMAILGFILYFIMYYQRNSFPVALVAMVNVTGTEDTNSFDDTCIAYPLNSTDSPEMKEINGEFDWTQSQQGLILGGFFWGYVVSKLFASRLAEIIGARATVTGGVAISSVLVFLSPASAYLHPYAIAANRFLVGACFGPLSSALHGLVSAWALRNELSFMVTIIYAGSSFGGMFGLLVSGWLQDHFGWKMTFWLGGVMNCVFLPFWIILVRDSPKVHPWLSAHERKLLQENDYITTKKYVPWKKILMSPYLHICTLCHFSRNYLDVILTTEGPSFFTYKMGLKLSTASYVCGGHYFLSVVFVMVFGIISDFIIERKWVTKIMARKIFQFITSAVSALLLLLVVLAGCNIPIVITLWIIMGATVDGAACSYFVSPIDVAPNYAATFMGLMAIGNMGSAVTPSITSALLELDNGWNKTFFVAAAINLVSCLVYNAFMTAEPQPWNFENEKEKEATKTKPKTLKKMSFSLDC